MMNRLLQIALLALGWPQLVATASAVSVPQTSASDYIFSRPLHTNHIRGVVVDTANPYRVIRSEDVDWLREAWEERNSIQAGRMSARPLRGAGPVVRSEYMEISITGTDWLDPAAPLLAAARLLPNSLTTTNTCEQAAYTNAWTNAFSVITMPMTNGAESVYTNRWRVHKRFPVSAVSTNVHSWTVVDFCHGVDGEPFPVYSNVNALVWSSFSETYAMFPTVKSIAYAREILRGTKRLADYGMLWTNETRNITEIRASQDALVENSTTTNLSSRCVFSYEAQHLWANLTRTDPFTAYVPTRFDSCLVTTGGANRVSVKAAYAKCNFSYDRSAANSPPASVATNAIVRLGNADLDLSGTYAICRIRMDAWDIFSACASAAGIPSPPASAGYRSSEGVAESWDFSVDSLVLFYSITPSVKLPDW